jgi:hypothetical protein
MTADPVAWECPSCGQQTATVEPRPPTPDHRCPQHRGLRMPYGRVLDDGRIEINRNTNTHQYLTRR